MNSQRIKLLFIVGMLSLIIASGTMAEHKWHLTMTTENADNFYTMTLGVMPGATDAYEDVVLDNPADQLPPPPIPGQTTSIDSSGVLGVPFDGKLKEDIRSDKSTISWGELILLVGTIPATLSWDLSQVPVDRTTVTLSDSTTPGPGTFLDGSFAPITLPIDMRAVSSQSFGVAAGTLSVTIESTEPTTTFSGNIVLAGSSPTTWSYTLLQDFNTVTQWSYIGATIQSATPASGWDVTTLTDTLVVFDPIGDGLVEGILEGFQITGDIGGTGHWESGLGGGDIDGPLPITLSSFTASIDGLNVVIKWTTESEQENMGFYIYRSESPTGPFVKVNGKIIKGAGTTGEEHTYKFVDEEVELGKAYYYYLENIDFHANKDISKIIHIDVLKLMKPMILRTQLLPNYPNPFNPETWIPYELAQDSDVTIEIYNLTGKLVRTLRLGSKTTGVYASKFQAAYWNGISDMGEEVSSGIYFYVMKAGDFTATRRMVLVK